MIMVTVMMMVIDMNEHDNTKTVSWLHHVSCDHAQVSDFGTCRRLRTKHVSSQLHRPPFESSRCHVRRNAINRQLSVLACNFCASLWTTKVVIPRQLQGLMCHSAERWWKFQKLHPWSLTWNLKIKPWKRRFLLETIIFRFHVKLLGVYPFKFLVFIHKNHLLSSKPAVKPS